MRADETFSQIIPAELNSPTVRQNFEFPAHTCLTYSYEKMFIKLFIFRANKIGIADRNVYKKYRAGRFQIVRPAN